MQLGVKCAIMTEASETGRVTLTHAMLTPPAGPSLRNGGRTLRVLLVDDHAMIREGIGYLLQSLCDCEVVEASSADDAVSQVAESGRPFDLALVDARMPGHDGLWALAQMRSLCPDLPVIMLSTFDTEDYVSGAIEGGANGYLLKEATTQQLREAIETACERRGVYIHPPVARALFNRSRRQPVDKQLTEREVEILRLLAAGATNDEVAASLYLSPKTVKTHLTTIFRKLDAANRTHAVAHAIRLGLVSAPGRPDRI